jgi:hypothetical protein
MFWLLTIVLIAIYLLALAVVLVFFEGAARANELWDRSNRALWQRARQFHSSREEQAA